MTAGDPTLDGGLTSWVAVAGDSPFPIQNLPLGAFRIGAQPPRVGVAIGAQILDLRAAAERDLLPAIVAAAVGAAVDLTPLLAAGRPVWRALRETASRLLDERSTPLRAADPVRDAILVAQGDVEMVLPMRVGDYVDFYSSREHATNLGRILRPGSEPLQPNWLHLPVGYHGRSATVVVDGTPVMRPCGQMLDRSTGAPAFGPTARLDIEVELGFVTDDANALGERVTVDSAEEHILGMVLVNDWSARDIQAWEYVPLGPFLGKSFATSVSAWVVTLDALAPYRVPAPLQDPTPLPYLRDPDAHTYDVDIVTSIRPPGGDESVVSRTNARHLYWTVAQQLAHATVNGARVRAGDLFASGTISGSQPGSEGSLIELTWNGERPLMLTGGATRTFLEDGDTVSITAWCGDGVRRPRIGFGSVSGTVIPATTR